jgi:integration host factor subunit alpha
MIKEDLIIDLSKKTGFSNNFSKKIINDFFSSIVNIIKTNKCIIKNIGTFKLINKKKRLGRNPKTKEEFVISKRKTVSFIASEKIIDFLNKDK